MSRFFVRPEDIYPDHINITGDDVNHIKKVLRLRVGEKITVCNSNGIDYLTEIESFEADYVRAAIISSEENRAEPPIDVTLFQGLPKSDKMDFIIQKGVELGVKRIVPVITERTIVRIENKKDAENKLSRWNRISLEAAKQCNRGIIPQIELPVTYDKAMEMALDSDVCLIPYEKEAKNSLKNGSLDKSAKKFSVFIGPEGGFEENEIQKAIARGIKPITLGPRILRTETAGIAVLSILMFEFGDVG